MSLNHFLRFVLVFLIFLKTTKACGMLTHTEISHRAFHNFKPRSLNGIDYKQYIIDYPSYFMAGSPFPDWGYACKFGSTAEDTHWPPFVHAYVEYLNSNYLDDQERRGKLISFLLGIESHGISDVVWHWGDSTSMSDQQGFLHSMGHMASNCQDDWQNCHTPGDAGGDFYLAYRGGLRWFADYWTAPIGDLDKIYKKIGSPSDIKVMTECILMMYTGAQLETLASILALAIYEKKAAFLSDDLDLWFHGGIDDMAHHVVWQWQNVIDLIEGKSHKYLDLLKRKEKLSLSKSVDMQRIISQLIDSEYFKSGEFISLMGIESITNSYGDVQFKLDRQLFHSNKEELVSLVGKILYPYNFGTNYNSFTTYFNLRENQKNFEGNNFNKIISKEKYLRANPYNEKNKVNIENLKANLNKKFYEDKKTNNQTDIFYRNNFDLNLDDIFNLDQLLLQPKNVLNSKIPFSYFGKSITYGDFDGDGIEELVVGAPGWGDYQTGAIFIFKKDTKNSQYEFGEKGNQDPSLFGEEPYSRYGYALTTVDVNQDGIDDLVVSAPTFGKNGPSQKIEDYYVKEYLGKIYIYLGNKNKVFNNSTKPDIVISNQDNLMNHSKNNTEENESRFYNLGYHLNSKDCNGDGYADLLIGSPYSSQGGDKRGHVAVFYKKLNTSGEISIQEADFKLPGEKDYQEFGYYITCEDNLVWVGAPGTRYLSSNEYQSSGAVFSYNLENQTLNSSVISNKQQSRFGASLEIDKNFLVVAAPSYSVFESQYDYHNGVVFTFSINNLTQQTDFNNCLLKIHSHEPRSRFGKSLKLVQDKLFISAPMYSYDANMIETGKIFVYDNIRNKKGEYTSDMAESIVQHIDQGARLGDTITINRNKSEIAISAPYTLSDEFSGNVILL